MSRRSIVLIVAVILFTSTRVKAQCGSTTNWVYGPNITETCGNVGVGTNAPQAQLEVKAGATALPATTGTAQPAASLRLGQNVGLGVLDFGFAGTQSAGWLQVTNSGDLTQTYNLLLNPNGGNVGLGTVTPTQKLDVIGNASISGNVAGGPLVTSTAFGFAGNFVGRSARGSAAAPTQTLPEDPLAMFGARGYEATTPGFTALSRARMTIRASDAYTTSSQGAYITFDTTATGTAAIFERLRITPAGDVGIGTTTPAAKLDVVGNLNATGTITGGIIHAKYQDVAEWVPSGERLTPGTVVVLDISRDNSVVPSSTPYATHVAGVVSAQPGIALGEAGIDKSLVATTGRVRVRVDATDPIAIGDLLVTSTRVGVAMRSRAVVVDGVALHRPGTVLGKALQALPSGTGEILVLLTLQ